MRETPEILFDARIPMRDGIQLSSDLYGVEPGRKKPAILFRTPYGKQSDLAGAPTYFGSNGYVFVASDVRGRGDSDGEFAPYEAEGIDGYDCINWICKQPWSNGRVATWGASYCGRIQWYTAVLQPRGLRAMVPIVTPSDPFVEDPTGLPSPLSISWDFLVSARSLQNTALVKWDPVYRHLPFTDMDELTGREMAHWRLRLKHLFMDEFNKNVSYQHLLEKVEVPVLHISGWYDDEQIGTPLNFKKMTQVSRKEVRENQSLLMGGWGHQVNKLRQLGEFDFGPEAIIDLLGYVREWLDGYMMEKHPRKLRHPVRLFVMGSNKWRNFDQWPPEGSSRTSIYITSNGSANSRFGDGKLVFTEPSHGERVDSYSYNPENPVPFIADQNYAQIGGPDDYSAIERRDDVLVYTSEPFKKDFEIIGPVGLSLDVSTSCDDTDFTGKLLVVTQTDKSIRLCDGVTRMSRRNGHRKGVPTVPGKIYNIDIDLWNTAYHWKPGERIRLEISSSAFPKYARNLNVFGDQSRMTDSKVAEQKIYHGGAHASALNVHAMTGGTGKSVQRKK